MCIQSPETKRTTLAFLPAPLFDVLERPDGLCVYIYMYVYTYMHIHICQMRGWGAWVSLWLHECVCLWVGWLVGVGRWARVVKGGGLRLHTLVRKIIGNEQLLNLRAQGQKHVTPHEDSITYNTIKKRSHVLWRWRWWWWWRWWQKRRPLQNNRPDLETLPLRNVRMFKRLWGTLELYTYR